MIEINKNILFIKRKIIRNPKNNESLNYKADILSYSELNEPFVTNYKNIIHKGKGYITILEKINDTNAFLSTFNETTRNAVRRSAREGVKWIVLDSHSIKKSDINSFSNMANDLYKDLGLKSRVNKHLLIIYKKNNGLCLTYTKLNNTILTYHLYIVDGERAISWYYVSKRTDASFDRNTIGRANRFHHFNDICYFANEGYKIYDWGGVSSFENPNGIDTFKYSFPGEKKYVYEQTIYKTKKGLLFSKLKEKL